MSHLDLDALADVLAGGPQPEHLQSCPSCRARLDELGTATTGVAATLAALPVPPMPDDLADRLSRAVEQAAAPAPTNVLPLDERRRMRWLPALGAVAAAAVLVVGGVLVANRGGGGAPSRTSDQAGSSTGYAVNDSGANYDAKQLAAALPGLLKGQAHAAAAPKAAAGLKAQAPAPVPTGERAGDQTYAAASGAADPLAPLRDTAGLARCLSSLTDPSESGLPLALDYASYQGTPALVVVLPSSKPDKVDVFVVPVGCARADGALLYFTRLPKP